MEVLLFLTILACRSPENSVDSSDSHWGTEEHAYHPKGPLHAPRGTPHTDHAAVQLDDSEEAVWDDLTPLALQCAEIRQWKGRSFYYGDLHSHTGVSGDGYALDLDVGCPEGLICGNYSTAAAYAREMGLDFVAITEHSNGDSIAEAALFNENIGWILDANDPDGGFVTIPGAEIWFHDQLYRPLGHKHLLMFGDNDRLRGITMAEMSQNGEEDSKVDSCDEVWAWMDGLRATYGDAILVPHHTSHSMPMPHDWECHSPVHSPVTEVYSNHGSNLMINQEFDPPWSSIVPSGTIERALDPTWFGYTLGFIAGTDSHLSLPGEVCNALRGYGYGGGLTTTVLPEGSPLSRASIYESLRTRQVYATSGVRIPVLQSVSQGGVVLGEMGDVIPLEREPWSLEVSVPDVCEPLIDRVEVRDERGEEQRMSRVGPGVWRWEGNGEIPYYAYPVIVVNGDVYYEDGCLDLGDSSEERIWMTPNWLAP